MTHPPELPPYDPCPDIGAVLAWAASSAPPVRVQMHLARVQRWLRLASPEPREYTHRLRIMLPAFALDLVQSMEDDERADMEDPGP